MSAGLGTRLVTGVPPTPFARRVLDAVDAIPPGRVLTYGDVAELLGSRAPRAVGSALAAHGHEVPWQRVVLASGEPAPSAPREALRLLRAEGCPLTADGCRVDLARARWDGRPALGGHALEPAADRSRRRDGRPAAGPRGAGPAQGSRPAGPVDAATADRRPVRTARSPPAG